MPLYPLDRVKRRKVGQNLYLYTFYLPELARSARPGQFVHLRLFPQYDPLLRRPFSIHQVDPGRGLVYLLLRATGRGTSLFSSRPFRPQDLLGPLGRGFTLPERPSRVAVVSGGMGAAPLVFLVVELARLGHEVSIFAGARSKSFFPAGKELGRYGFPVYPATDDGTLGFTGAVTELFRREGRLFRPEKAYACGPEGMLRAFKDACIELNCPGEVSLEEFMACGVGACQGCAVPACGGGEYLRVCADGPVFDIAEVF